MAQHKNLAAALAAVQAELPTIAKSHTAKVRTNSGADYSYTYADLADVTNETLPVLAKHGLAFTALPRQTESGFVLVGTLIHESGEKAEGALPLFGRDAQSIGSSLTYMRRYLLGCLTGVVTDDDDDGQNAQGKGRTQQPQRVQQAPQNGAGQPPPPEAGYSAGSRPPQNGAPPPNGVAPGPNQAGEPAGSPGPTSPEAQALADGAKRVRSINSLRNLHAQAVQKRLLNHPVAHPISGVILQLGAYFQERKNDFEHEPQQESA